MIGCDGAGDFVLAINLVGAACVYDGEWPIVDGVGRETAVWRDDVYPFRKEQVDLADVLLQGRVARRIVFNVIGRAQTFAGVQRDVRWLQIGLSMS